ncbi:pyridoxal 5'-phosphate synthase glutaminase subunit PdxT [Cellulomonas bogoriensis]|uniref:Pyridoxal 5'-phosphate synthase subunit PdxT n=1 Tax=Cellulomonas bogoriensis 69B4 = DSM 16987 TaxID=1386082 RepID=A0A0A0C1A6_9CELL|nr:pyridoxal 5'-phosphate synthase glutaminase subunit PdxT [Cellulomonas bogoriensis]KGM13717.1 glutamine amidotransferase [Cellulomonas bogoriensis 69B4 = DSM 16987]
MTSPIPTIGVLALQGDVREHTAALEAAGARVVPLRRERELRDVDGVVLPGGESTTIEKLLHVFELFEPLRAALGSGLPAFGSCAGMILLADRVLGGVEGQGSLGGLDITVRRNAFGRQVDSFETDLVVEGVPDSVEDPVRAVFIRAPWVEESGAGVQVLASVGEGPAAGRIVAVRERDVMATSFHPEVTGDLRLHRMFVQIVADRG